MKNLLKSFSLLFSLSLLLACSNPADTAIIDNSKTITGTVKSIEFGKDGYTATMTTVADETYLALISIPNVGGPNKYTTLKINDVATLKGKYQRLNGENHLMTTEIKEVDTTIAGTVQSIENGKDGYTAQIKGTNEQMYAVVVSIVNMGGPDNFTQVAVGDRVIVEGQQLTGMGEIRIIAKKIRSTASPHTQLLVGETSFRGIHVGDKITDHSEYIEKGTLRTGEGDFDVYYIKDFNNNPAGYFDEDPNNEALVGDITVTTPSAKTIEGIHIGSTFQELKDVSYALKVHGSEVESRTYAYYNNLAYRLNVANASYEIDQSTIPATTKITEIIIKRGAASTEELAKKYQDIVPEEYCWLVNDAVELFNEPSRASKKLGPHYKGEVLKVLGSQIIKNKLWVNVEFTLQIKTGYDDQFADGQVWPSASGVYLGWIDGAGNPLINCK